MYQQFTYVDKNLFNESFSNFSFYKQSVCNESSYLTNFINEVIYHKFIFTANSPMYRIYFYFTFISKFTIDLTMHDIKVDNDIITLRDLILSFIIYYFNVFNNLEINDVFVNYIGKYNLNKIKKRYGNLL